MQMGPGFRCSGFPERLSDSIRVPFFSDPSQMNCTNDAGSQFTLVRRGAIG
ncbi:MAG: hypothetical protein Kow0026_18850 [Oricola sp.]